MCTFMQRRLIQLATERGVQAWPDTYTDAGVVIGAQTGPDSYEFETVFDAEALRRFACALQKTSG